MSQEKKPAPHTYTFEKAFERLEAILEIFNSQHPTLDESLKLYEEADALISFCATALQSAERKIETLIKNRKGELEKEDGKPLTQDMEA